MERVELLSVLPRVFEARPPRESDVWLRSLTLERGKTYLVVADSGTGKSSLCSFVTGYRDDYLGHIRFDGADARSLTVGGWVTARRRSLSHLFQELRLFPELTAYENVEIKNRLTRFKTRRQILQWLDMLGVGDKADTKAGLMSFGQQQRVALARALAQPFDFLLADEPVSHLDDTNSRLMGQLMLQEARAQGAGLIVTSIGKHMDLPYDKTLRL